MLRGRRSFPTVLTGLLLVTLAPGAGIAGGSEDRPDPAPEAAELAFLGTVAPLLSKQEREAFLALDRDYQRRAFVEAFWRARNPHPETPLNELRDRWERGLEQVEELFGGLADERGEVWLLRGPTDERIEVHCPQALVPLEIWIYPADGEGKRELFVFAGERPRRLWDPASGLESLATDPPARDAKAALEQRIVRNCSGGRRLFEWLREAQGPERLATLAARLAPRDPGWLDEFFAGSTNLPPGARSLPATLLVQPGGPAPSGTAVQLTISVPRRCCPELDNGRPAFRVVGDVVRRGRLHDRFRYRFEPAADPYGGTTLRLERHLPAGAYHLVLFVEAEGTGRYFRAERSLEVPRASPVDEPSKIADPATRGATLRLLPLPEETLQTGRVRVRAAASGDIERVTFLLNNRPVLSRSRPPFTAVVNLGEELRTHTVAVHALDSQGRVVARDERLINAGPHRFSVRLLEPRALPPDATSLRAVVRVEPPEGARAERLDLHLNEARVATLYQPPWVQTLPVPSRDEPTVLRATAHLADGLSQEDTRVLDLPGHGERIQVDFVELFTTVLDRRGGSVEDFRAEEVTVLEDGLEQRILRFERVQELPLHIALVVDTSGSMAESLSTVEEAGLKLFREVIRSRDRAALFRFSNRPELVVRFTNDHELLAGGLAGLVAEGWTALHDSIVEALYYMQGIKGRRALILLSDGVDNSSRHSFADALEYARRAEVTIYTVAIGLPQREATVRYQLRLLAQETGGQMFSIASAGQLDRIYANIERQLRSQYLIGYQSSQSAEGAEEFRTVELEVHRDGIEAKTIRGYFP